MRLYEIVYIFDATLDEDGVNKKLDKFHPLVLGKNGEVAEVDHWGVRQMAYPVKKHGSGYYVVAQVRAETDGLPEFERVLRLDVELLRYLIVLNEGEPTTGHSLLGATPPSRADKDEGDGDEEDGPAEDPPREDEDADRGFSPPEFSGGRGRRRRMEGPVIELLNYKDVSTLSHFMTEQGKILPKRTTKVTARFQRDLGRAIKRARYLALIPYIRDHEV
ncbi:MAG TPA: 30S ribosomal protein S6 [Candidatus Latescibacteria bacterium]|nr:30S ribosomal protein S6 [Candidatus Latescibacterota bacterium]